MDTDDRDRVLKLLMTTGQEDIKEEPKVEVECPKCGHKFWHNVKDGFKKAVDSLGNAIGEAKFGG